MRLLDLFCGAGGAAAGYARLGWELTGIDIAPQPRALESGMSRFVQAEALTYLWEHGAEYDAIHASPPCQRFSTMTRRHGSARTETHPDLIGPTRDLLRTLGRPYVIENVVGAPLCDPILLCGSMFDLGAMVGDERWQLRRHRIFEANFTIPPQSCDHRGRTVGVYGHAGGRSRRDGLVFATTEHWREAMGIDWMTGKELAEAIPPVYTSYIGRFL